MVIWWWRDFSVGRLMTVLHLGCIKSDVVEQDNKVVHWDLRALIRGCCYANWLLFHCDETFREIVVKALFSRKYVLVKRRSFRRNINMYWYNFDQFLLYFLSFWVKNRLLKISQFIIFELFSNRPINFSVFRSNLDSDQII